MLIEADGRFEMSVIIIAFNQGGTVPLIISELDNQTTNASFEVIISDDGSSSEHQKAYHLAALEARRNVKYVWHKSPLQWASAARNNGIKLARGRVLLFLDGDMIPSRNLIQQHSDWHRTGTRIVAGNRKWRGALSDVLRSASNAHIDSNWLEAYLPDLASQKREEVERQRRLQWYSSVTPWRACFSANVSVPRNELVYFDEEFVGWGPEDLEFNYRLCVKHGFEPIYDDTMTSFHLETPDAIGNVFRGADHEAIVRYMLNAFRAYYKCDSINVEDIFFGMVRFKLRDGEWTVVKRDDQRDVFEATKMVYNWLLENGYFTDNQLPFPKAF